MRRRFLGFGSYIFSSYYFTTELLWHFWAPLFAYVKELSSFHWLSHPFYVAEKNCNIATSILASTFSLTQSPKVSWYYDIYLQSKPCWAVSVAIKWQFLCSRDFWTIWNRSSYGLVLMLLDILQTQGCSPMLRTNSPNTTQSSLWARSRDPITASRVIDCNRDETGERLEINVRIHLVRIYQQNVWDFLSNRKFPSLIPSVYDYNTSRPCLDKNPPS